MDGNGGDYLIVPAGGSRIPASVNSVNRRKHFIKQDGKYFALEVNSIPAWRGIQSVHDNNITDSFIKCMFE